MEWPGRDPDYDHSRANWPHNFENMELIPDAIEDHAWVFVSHIRAISNVPLRATCEVNEFEVEIRENIFSLYCPYVLQEPIKPKNDESKFTLAAMSLGHSYNWMVCEEVKKQDMECTSEDRKKKMVQINVLRGLANRLQQRVAG